MARSRYRFYSPGFGIIARTNESIKILPCNNLYLFFIYKDIGVSMAITMIRQLQESFPLRHADCSFETSFKKCGNFISIYKINRPLHGRLGIRILSSHAETKIIFGQQKQHCEHYHSCQCFARFRQPPRNLRPQLPQYFAAHYIKPLHNP